MTKVSLVKAITEKKGERGKKIPKPVLPPDYQLNNLCAAIILQKMLSEVFFTVKVVINNNKKRTFACILQSKEKNFFLFKRIVCE